MVNDQQKSGQTCTHARNPTPADPSRPLPSVVHTREQQTKEGNPISSSNEATYTRFRTNATQQDGEVRHLYHTGPGLQRTRSRLFTANGFCFGRRYRADPRCTHMCRDRLCGFRMLRISDDRVGRRGQSAVLRMNLCRTGGVVI